MNIGLIDVDGHHFPNLALMRISAWHKARGDDVNWWWGWDHYDIVYMSKIFSDAYSPDIPEPLNADKVIKGGTGYAISLDGNGREVFDKSKNESLPPEVEKMFPDYSIYPQFDFAVAMTSRGCPRACAFCHVAAKEGRCSVKVADVKDFWNGQKSIEVLDPNITACREKRDLFRQYRETGALINFNQGLDIRLLNDDDAEDLRHMRLKDIHFAWDNPEDDLTEAFKRFTEYGIPKSHGAFATVYVLTNFANVSEEEHIEQAKFRIYKLRELGFDPFLMLYDKAHAPKSLRHMQRWCNNKYVFKKCPRFEDYTRLR